MLRNKLRIDLYKLYDIILIKKPFKNDPTCKRFRRKNESVDGYQNHLEHIKY